MAFSAVFAAILSVLAAAGEVRADALPQGGEGARPVGDAAPGVSQPAGDEDDTPEDEEAAARPESPAGPLVAAPGGDTLADSAPVLIVRSERKDGWALERLLEPSGEIVEHLVDRAGTVQSCRAVGSLFTLRVIEQRAAQGGESVQVVRDASGALLRLAVGPDGEPRAVALLAPPPR